MLSAPPSSFNRDPLDGSSAVQLSAVADDPSTATNEELLRLCDEYAARINNGIHPAFYRLIKPGERVTGTLLAERLRAASIADRDTLRILMENTVAERSW